MQDATHSVVPLLSSPGHFAEQLEGSGNREGARLPWLTQPWLAAARGSPAGQHATNGTPLLPGVAPLPWLRWMARMSSTASGSLDA